MANTLQPQGVAQLGTGFSTVYTVPGSTKATLSVIHLANTSGAAVTVQVCHVPTGGSALQANALLWNHQLAANAVLEFGKGIMMDEDETIQALASVGTSVNLSLSLIEST